MCGYCYFILLTIGIIIYGNIYQPLYAQHQVWAEPQVLLSMQPSCIWDLSPIALEA